MIFKRCRLKAIIETSKNSKVKYELKNNKLVLDERTHIKFPANYGFIPDTYYYDKDNLDVMVIGIKLKPKQKVDVRAIGLIEMIDNNVKDDKVLAVLKNSKIKTINDVSKDLLNRIRYFLMHYKPNTKVFKYANLEKTKEAIKKSINLFKKNVL